mgnify:CR=1 FL=1|jgi:protein O-GlcNAc transferase
MNEIFEHAITAHTEGKLEDAVRLYQIILKTEPTHPEANNNLGILLNKFSNFNEAEAHLKKAVEFKPDYTTAHFNLANVLTKLDKLSEAETSYKKAIELKSDYEKAHFNLANVLTKLDRLSEAEKSYKKTIELNPNNAGAHNNLGNILSKLDKLSEAEASYRKALEFKPDFSQAHYNLGLSLEKLNKLDEALISYDRAKVLKPNINYLLGNLLHLKMHLCIWDDLPSDLRDITEKINNREKVSNPSVLLSLIDDLSIHKKTAEIFSNHKFPKSDIMTKIQHYHGHEKIKIGYFSADFRDHVIAYLTAELYEKHDRKKFEIHAFSFGLDTKDEFNTRIKAGVDHFHDVSKMSDQDVTILARSLEIDIAIDLGGYTNNSRTGIFAMSVAPIQACYLGYTGTMGADYMNYLIADRTVIPKDMKHHYSEKIVYLPNSYMVHDSKVKLSKKIFTRVDFGLPINGFVFCCFNKFYKITPNTFVRWMKILSQIDGSVLWLSGMSKTAINNLKKEAKKNGVDKNRIIFAPSVLLKEEYMSRIKLADLFIDTLPYNAHSTSSDALRMGVPVLTCIGKSFAGRVTASLLNAVKLPELITTSEEQYESLAIQLAKHPEKLKIITNKLIDNLSKTALYDTALFTRHLEAAYLVMYERYKNESVLDDIEI